MLIRVMPNSFRNESTIYTGTEEQVKQIIYQLGTDTRKYEILEKLPRGSHSPLSLDEDTDEDFMADIEYIGQHQEQFFAE